jgi:hypothetical protein
MNEYDKLILQMELLNSIIESSRGYGEVLTPSILREILRESLLEIENKIVNLKR